MNSTRRRRERGQVVPIVAIAVTLLLGATALAVDLSLQTHNKRGLQNVTDTAALTAAQYLGSSPTATDQYNGAEAALLLIHKQMGWPTFSGNNSTWASTAVQACGSTYNTTNPPVCDIDLVPPSPYNTYDIKIQSPAKSSNNSSYRSDDHYFDVKMSQTVKNTFASVIGYGSSTEASLSTAYHFAPSQPFGFALFAKRFAATQNKSTLVEGDVYAERYVDPQSAGQAGFCTEGGLIILGSPQAGDTGYANDGQDSVLPKSADSINYLSDCGSGPGTNTNTTAKGTVNQTRDPTAGCSNEVSGVSYTATYNSSIGACVAKPTISAPSLEEPTLPSSPTYCGSGGKVAGTYQPGVYTCSSGTALTIDAPLAAGVYRIQACSGCNGVVINQSETMHDVTFILENGSSFTVDGNGITVEIDPYIVSNSTNPGDGRYPIYAPSGSASTITVTKNGAELDLFGTLYAPDGTVNITSNAHVDIVGQAIVDNWNDQGGDHTAPDITYDASRVAGQREILRLSE